MLRANVSAAGDPARLPRREDSPSSVWLAGKSDADGTGKLVTAGLKSLSRWKPTSELSRSRVSIGIVSRPVAIPFARDRVGPFGRCCSAVTLVAGRILIRPVGAGSLPPAAALPAAAYAVARVAGIMASVLREDESAIKFFCAIASVRAGLDACVSPMATPTEQSDGVPMRSAPRREIRAIAASLIPCARAKARRASPPG